MQRCLSRPGFTLLELLVVIAVIGFLSTVAVAALNNARTKARDTRRLADMKQISQALGLRLNASGSFPGCVGGSTCTPGSNELGVDMTCIDGSDFATNPTACDGALYMGVIPDDPGGSAVGNPCTGASTGDCNYAYDRGRGAGASGDQAENFEILYRLESGAGGYASGVHCATESGLGLISSVTCAH